MEEEPEMQYFQCALLLADDLEGTDIPALQKFCASLTHKAMVGAYYVDEEGMRLMYKLGVPLDIDLSDEDLFNEMNIVIGNAISIVDSSLYDLLQIVDGE